MFPFLAIAFLCGDLYIQTFAELPSYWWMILAFCILFFMRCFISQSKVIASLLLMFFLGLLWTNWIAHQSIKWTLDKNLEGKEVQVVGEVIGIPEVTSWGIKFVFLLEQLAHKNVMQTVQLTWPDSNMRLHVGERMTFFAKLKRIHTTLNPGSFDYEAWALQKGIRAKGIVITKKGYKKHTSKHSNFMQFLRDNLYQKIMKCLPQSETAVWLPALMIGQHSVIKKEFWEVLRKTGTNHLMAIAGLHIGIIAGLSYFLMNRLWRLFPDLMLWLPASHAAHCAALMMAIFYSFLAGFSLPTQRACIMLIIFSLAHLRRRQINAWHGLSIALLIVLFLNPLVVLSESFWLSFGTIALILFCMHNRIQIQGWWWKWGRVQWIIGLGLIPITLLFFQQSSLISFVANSIAIPWLSFLILPFCFIANFTILVSPTLTYYLLIMADRSLAGLWFILTYFSNLKFAVFEQAFTSQWLLVTTLLGIVIWLLPAGMHGRYMAFIFCLPIFFISSHSLNSNDFNLTLLDVGQGLSAIVQTKHHSLIYDTGAKYANNLDAGESIVLPYLLTNALHSVDYLVISHPDNDHIGGAKSILEKIPIEKIFASSFKKLSYANVFLCLAGKHWHWDGVEFKFIYPTSDHLNLGNNSSCVLQISNGKFSVLLTGDIEKYAENTILQLENNLKADVIIAPHHGSKTSSSKNFITAVNPSFVVYATGYLNRYHFPHPSVMQRYDNLHALSLNTTLTGAIEFQFSDTLTYKTYREAHKRYWYDH